MVKKINKNSFKFTKSKLDKLPAPEKGKIFYKDSEEKGLQVYITPNGVKTFCLRRKIKGKSYFITFGQFGEITIDTARKKCLKAKADLADGINVFESIDSSIKEQTFEQAVKQYIDLHSKKHKNSKLVSAEEKYLSLYLNRLSKIKVSEVTKEDVIRAHSRVTKNNGEYIANRVVAFVRAMFNWKIDNQNWEHNNPASRIKLNKEIKKDRFVQKEEKKRLLRALENEPNELARDFFYIALLSGVRKGNILTMKWEQIDFNRKVWRIPLTKNDEPHNAPLVDEVIEILKKRKTRNRKLGYKKSPYVLPSKTSINGHFSDPKKAWQRILKEAEIENLTIHDLRRTMGSYMTMQGTNLQTVGKVLGHKNPASTAIYARLDVDTARRAMENATQEILN